MKFPYEKRGRLTSNGVLGGGALGLTAALRLAQRGEEVVLFEREPTPGGLAAGFQCGPSYLEKFYHHLFRSDTEATALINELGLGDKLVWPRPITASLIGGRVYPLDSPMSVLRFSAVPFLDRLRLGAAIAYLKAEPNYHRLEKSTADVWIRRYMGRKVHEAQWKPLLESKFGDRYQEIVMAWFWARVHFRSASLGYVRGGFQQLYNRLVEEIQRLGGETRFTTSVTSIERTESGKLRVSTSDGEREFDRVISTLPTRLTVQLTPELQGEYGDRYSTVDSYGAHCVILALDRQLTDIYWLNVNDRGYPFLALVEHTNYMAPEDYGRRRLVYLGNYLPMDHPLFKKSDAEVLAEFLPFLQRINPAFDPSWVTEHWIFKAPFAQPIVTVGYADRLPPHETPIPNFYVANMSQVYPQDRGQNYSIGMANRLVNRLVPSA